MVLPASHDDRRTTDESTVTHVRPSLWSQAALLLGIGLGVFSVWVLMSPAISYGGVSDAPVVDDFNRPDENR
jgi:hypothetical protein